MQLAGYVPSRRELAICPMATSYGLAMVKESIAHEAIHAAQQCNGFWMGTNRLTPLGYYYMSKVAADDPGLNRFLGFVGMAKRDKAEQIRLSAGTDGVLELLEIEAYAYEGVPEGALQIFEEFCVHHFRW